MVLNGLWLVLVMYEQYSSTIVWDIITPNKMIDICYCIKNNFSDCPWIYSFHLVKVRFHQVILGFFFPVHTFLCQFWSPLSCWYWNYGVRLSVAFSLIPIPLGTVPSWRSLGISRALTCEADSAAGLSICMRGSQEWSKVICLAIFQDRSFSSPHGAPLTGFPLHLNSTSFALEMVVFTNKLCCFACS